ncbi:glycosyltransferase family 61 protein, partial [Falsiroseomonas oryziterrae]|uniref:glycosyltransferase family 61 protein n=1 Tax=Falsiroseomonas oryziterrae TaxID=2911368 RepID=UPI001F3535D2
SVFQLCDAALLGPGLLIATPRGVVAESQLGQRPEVRAAVAAAIRARPRPALRRAGTVALAVPLHPAAPDPRSLAGFNHYHLHTEHLCALLQIEALRRTWPGEHVETLLPAGDPLHAEAQALLAAELGAARTIGEEEIRATRLLVPNRCLHHKAPDPLVAEVFARIRRNALAGAEAEPGGPRIYVARFGAAARWMRNEAELAASLAARGFAVFDARRLRYREQVLALAGARIIVGAHGAGLTNMGFAEPGALLVECFSPFFYSQCFQQLAAIAGHRYRAFRQPPAAAAHPQAPWDLDIPAFLGFLDRVLEAEERRCDSQALP